MIRELASKPPEPLEVFAALNGFDGRGALSVALFVTDRARDLEFPISVSNFQSSSGAQIKGLSGAAIKRILARHGITEELASEGGRTSRGSLQRARTYIDWLNRSSLSNTLDLDKYETFWVGRVRKIIAGERTPQFHVPAQRPAPAKFEWRDELLSPVPAPPDSIKGRRADLADFVAPLRSALDRLIPLYAHSNQHRELHEIFYDLRTALEGSLAEVARRDFEIGFIGLRLENTVAEYDLRNEELPSMDAGPLGTVKAIQAAYGLLERRMRRWVEFKIGSAQQIGRTATDQVTLDIVSEAIEDIAAESEARSEVFDPQTPRSLRAVLSFATRPLRTTKAAVYGVITTAENLALALASRLLAIATEASDSFQKDLGRRLGRTGQAAFLVATAASLSRLAGVAPENWTWFHRFIEQLGKYLINP